MSDDRAPLIDLGAFDRVDTSASPEDYLRWMEHQRRQGPDRSLEMLELTQSSVMLDVGCGSGSDLSAVADKVAFAVGIDRSLTMVRSTRDRDIAPAPAVLNGDGVALPFADRSFDACWVRAVLVHNAEPQRVVDEIARVLRPGGRAVFSEPDQGSHIVSTPELELFERIKSHRQRQFQNPFAGRQVPFLAANAGLRVGKARLAPILHRSLDSALSAGGPLGAAVERAVADGAISDDEARRYVESLQALDAQGAFVFAALAMIVPTTLPETS